jgi:DNA (cytosine-5)-methyltransferase 1
MPYQTHKQPSPRKKGVKKINIPLLSFFTGGGFLDMGFEKEGFEIVWTNENNHFFADLYEAGYSSWRSAYGKPDCVKITERRSLENLDAGRILDDAFGKRRPVFFGVIGGPPCQDFCSAGKHQGFDGERGRLTRTYINMVCDLAADFVVLENVSGLYKFAKHRPFLLELVKQLENAGYAVDYHILNAINFHVPQNRERFFLVGISKTLLSSSGTLSLPKQNGHWFAWPRNKNNPLTDCHWPKTSRFGGRPRKPRGIPEELFVASYLISNSHCEGIANGTDTFRAHSSRFHEIDEGDTSGKSFKRLHRYRYSPTACYGNNEVHLHPWEPRRLSLREVMRIQGIPDTYVLPENNSLTNKFKLVGNGVPVPLAREVARCVKQYIRNNCHSFKSVE